jgi:hypothetical protein
VTKTEWPEVVGYRHEVVHTGVLHSLVRDPARAPTVASALIDASVRAVVTSSRESHLPESRRTADLVAELHLGSGESCLLAVETKVDSTATQDQLQETVRRPQDRGILLGLGITALNLTTFDLPPEVASCWQVIDPEKWSAILRSVGADSDSVLAPYLRAVAQEAHEHAEARARAIEHPLETCWLDDSRRQDGLLEHYAWLAEVRGRLDHRSDWWTYTNRSGPLMGYWATEFQRFGSRDIFLEFMCSDTQRSLCLKIGSGTADLLATAEAALSAVEPFGWVRPARRAQSTSGTCTAARLDLSALAAPEAAARTRRAIAEVAA